MANDLELRLLSVFQEIGADIKTANAERGDLTSLTTVEKNNLVGAINEVAAASGAGALLAANNLSDVVSAAIARTNLSVSSTAEMNTAINAATALITLSALGGLTQAEVDARAQIIVDSVIDSAPGTLNTLNELAAALGDDPNFATTIASDLANRVSYTAQTKTLAERTVACQNIGVGNPDRDYLLDYTTARDS